MDNDLYEQFLKLKMQALRTKTEAKYLLYMVKDLEKFIVEKEQNNGRNN